jgi:hypothetical protein
MIAAIERRTPSGRRTSAQRLLATLLRSIADSHRAIIATSMFHACDKRDTVRNVGGVTMLLH